MKPTEVARAYDAIAPTYDEQVRGDDWMRRVLWERFRQTFRPGERVLDVGCGTGADALFLAGLGIRVLAVDAAPAMIARVRAKAEAGHLAERVEARVMDFSSLDTLPTASFDGIISSFAGLNTAPDLRPFAADAARLLRPGGRMVLHLLGGFSLWEWLGLLAHGQWQAAAKLGRQNERSFPIGGQVVRHYLADPDATYRDCFARSFRLRRADSLGCLHPPANLRRVPRPLVTALSRVEPVVAGRRPFLNWGRFFVLDLERRDEPEVAGPGGPR
ncbi:MAG TPA: class I SAM-dependent methyltransferase [Chloroflexota bacterium]|nr:class I SAM-dependent methyltransferase [Chloroflexota bacterium]